MEEKIRLLFGNLADEFDLVILNKLETAQKILELLETKEVTSIDVTYKEKEPATECKSVG